MKIVTTNYSRVAEYLAKNTYLIEDATSYNSLANTLNSIFGLKMRGATVSTIVASLHGFKEAKSLHPLKGIRYTLMDNIGNESYLVVGANRVYHKNGHCSFSLSNLQYKGDFAFDVQEMFRDEQYSEIEHTISTKCIAGKIINIQYIR